MTQVAFYVAAGKETGHGHIVRCLALADELKERGCECVFFTNFSGREYIGQRYHAICIEEIFFGLAQLGQLDSFEIPHSDIWIVDLEGGCPPALATLLRGMLVILNGVGYPDGDPGRLLADLVFYQGVTRRPYELEWPGFEGEWFEGPEWLILRKDFRSVKAKPGTHDPPRVVVTGGGGDPKDVTRKALLALADLDIQTYAIVGPSNEHDYEGIPYYKFQCDPVDMAESLAWADIAIVSYGMTAFECLALGLPTIALSISPDHAASADLVQEQSYNALHHLGEVENVTSQDIRQATEGALAAAPYFSKMARNFIDGKGTQRVTQKIMEVFDELD